MLWFDPASYQERTFFRLRDRVAGYSSRTPLHKEPVISEETIYIYTSVIYEVLEWNG